MTLETVLLVIAIVISILIFAKMDILLNPDDAEKYRVNPCNEYLNNALFFLAADENPNRHAINEIVKCIKRAGGEIVSAEFRVLSDKDLLPKD